MAAHHARTRSSTVFESLMTFSFVRARVRFRRHDVPPLARCAPGLLAGALAIDVSDIQRARQRERAPRTRAAVTTARGIALTSAAPALSARATPAIASRRRYSSDVMKGNRIASGIDRRQASLFVAERRPVRHIVSDTASVERLSG
ncbi:hypothetical protein SZ31_06790 [Burkholderia pseudomallei]|nr:hypothetical protein SZ31_06790 [Burkholderia pseudomallei]